MTDASQTPPAKSVADASSSQQTQVAALIVLILGVISFSAIAGAVWVALVAMGENGSNATTVAIFVGLAGLVHHARGDVRPGGLVNALSTPSGVASVIRSAKVADSDPQA